MSAVSSSRGIRAVVLVVLLAMFAAVSAGAASAEQYAALGDSYSSGVGTGSYTLDSACKRSVYAYPYLVAQKRANTSLTFVACSGAKTSDLLANQLSAVTSTTSIVTLTIGGNDIGFADLIYRCTLSDCSSALDTTRTNLETTLGISSTEQSKANQLADALDNVIATHARADGVIYQSAIGPFTGHAVCSSSPWLNGLNLFSTGESYHPNRAGHSSGYLPLVRAIIG